MKAREKKPTEMKHESDTDRLTVETEIYNILLHLFIDAYQFNLTIGKVSNFH